METTTGDDFSPTPTTAATATNVAATFADWDQTFSDEELEAIDSIIRSATSSARKIEIPGGDRAEERPKTRRRLPDSLFVFGQKPSGQFSGGSASECSSPGEMSVSNSPYLIPCPRNRFSSPYTSPLQVASKLRYPTMTFGGHIFYSRTPSEVEKAADDLLRFVENKKREAGRAIIGFDIEWRPSFRKGVLPGKAAVMQICVNTSSCHVMHIIHSGIPCNLQSLLEDPKSLKVGVGIANDARKVLNDHNVAIKALEDLSCLANRKLGGLPKNWSLKSLTETLICKQLPKPGKIRLGNWEAYRLSKQQLQYAATDAFVSWYLFEVLNSLQDAVDTVSEKVGNAVCS